MIISRVWVVIKVNLTKMWAESDCKLSQYENNGQSHKNAIQTE